MSTRSWQAVRFTAREQAELVPVEPPAEPLGASQIEGRTVVSLISAGTEAVGCYAGTHADIDASSYPMGTGYAGVFVAEEIGSAVPDIVPGDLVFAACNHQSHQRCERTHAVKVPAGLAAETAVFARMAKIAMPSLVHTRVRPPEQVVVTGLGVVGLLAAQLAHAYGYEVIAVDPDAGRREIAARHGIARTVATLADVPELQGRVGLGLDCSGHEQAVADLCGVVRTRGEVFLIGVPWRAQTDLPAQAILHAIFYNYVVLQSGWEGRMPPDPDIHSQRHHFEAALRWLAEGRLHIDPTVYRLAASATCQDCYQALLHGRTDTLTIMFDWRD